MTNNIDATRAPSMLPTANVSVPSMLPMTLEAAAQSCPAIMADGPAAGVSDRYSFLSTHAVLRSATEAGWTIHDARQQVSKDPLHAAHRIILRHPSVSEVISGCHFQVQLLNSHNRSRRWSTQAGLFRQVCSNGLVVTISGIARVSLLHLQNILRPEDVLKSMDHILKEAPAVYASLGRYSKVRLNNAQQGEFAREALAARYGSYPPTVSEAAVLHARRKDDEGDSLWRVFNRVQENIMMGCVDGTRVGNHTSKPVTSLQEQVIVNKKLWALMEQYSKVSKN